MSQTLSIITPSSSPSSPFILSLLTTLHLQGLQDSDLMLSGFTGLFLHQQVWTCDCQGLQDTVLKGRPEKLPDVCYSWWVLASMAIIRRLHWINKVDPFHTLFGLAGLSLLGDSSVQAVNPVYCMPDSVIRRLNLATDTDCL